MSRAVTGPARAIRTSRRRPRLALAALTGCLAAALLAAPTTATAARAAAPSPPSPPSGTRPDPTTARDEEQRLPQGWKASEDRLWTARGDRDGLHVLAADLGDGYSWRTVATLREPGFETSSWVGNTCLTSSGRYVVATYAPREFTNHEDSFLRGAFTAVVDLESGDVRRLPIRSTMAYHNPGCGDGEHAVIAQQRSGGTATIGAATRLFRVDAASGEVSGPVTVPGQVTSALPTRGGIVAAAGRSIVAVEQSGTVRVLAPAASVPADLTLDGRGDLHYLVGTRARNAILRLPVQARNPRATLVAEARGDWLGLERGADGRVFALGRELRPAALGTVVAVPADARTEISTTGEAWLEKDRIPDPRTEQDEWQRSLTLRRGPDGGVARDIDLVARLRGSGESLRFRVTPGLRPAARYGTEVGQASPFLARESSAMALATGGTSEPASSCAVPRNDAKSQVYQPTARQVEWAADQAVVNNLKTARPANWKQSGLASWAPQGMFPSKALAGGGRVPVQILLGILAQESNLWQASSHAMPGVTGNPLVGNFYGRDVYDDDDSNDWIINFADADCGYGVGQVTDGMRKSGHARPGEVLLPANQQRAIALDYATNIARALQILQEKWNQAWNAGVIHDTGDPAAIENWVFAVWAYNSGFHPKGTTGQPWGVGWLNNPANPNYPPNRYMFNTYGTDPAHPGDWPYQEKVLGWAANSIATPDGPGFRAAWWLSTQDKELAQAPESTFCTAANNCDYGGLYTPNDPAVSGEPAGPCAHKNSAGLYDLQCWFHSKAYYRDCTSGYCGHELLRFNTTYPEQPDGTYYPPVCTTAGLPSGALVVDDVPATVKSPRPGCGHPWTEKGTFSLSFADPSGRVDFHQIGGGMGGHFWFAHTRKSTDVAGKLKVTGTWAFTTSLTKWARVLVHMPDHGAHTQQAAYKVHLGDGKVKTRYALQRTRANKWVSLGVMKFNGIPKITLSSQTYDGHGGDDIAFDAVAIQPLAAKPRNFVVALGDSYSSGEGANDPTGGDDYYTETDVLGDVDDDLGRNACHRSPFAWSRKARLKDSTSTLGQRADAWDNQLDFQLHACSGAQTEHILPYYTVPAGETKPKNLFDQEGRGQFGEMSQMDKGYLDENTTLVTISMGGNDARFSDIVKECIYAAGLQSCPDTELSGESEDMDVQVPADINSRVRRSIEVTVVEIAKRAPNAKIVLMGYPKLLEYSGVCIPGINTEEGDWMNEMGGVMDAMFVNLVGTSQYGLKAAGYKVWYSSPVDEFSGEAICGDPETIHGIVLDKTESDPGGLNPTSAQSFHPKISGTDHYRDALQATLREPDLALGN